MRAFEKLIIVIATILCCTAGAAWSQPGQELTVAAALSLKSAFEEIAVLYEEKYPGERIRFNFAASGVLQRQIEAGVPVDVFASAASRELDELERKKLLADGSRRSFARNRIVLIVPAGVTTRIHSFADLADIAVKRLAMGNPATVPAGKYADEVLRLSGMRDRLSGRLVLCENVRQVLDYTVRNEVDAGILFATDAAAVRGVVVAATAPAGSHSPAVYHAAALKDAKRGAAARNFIDLLLSSEGQAVLKRRGFQAAQ
ncbi:MAG: molybdate ABC transporter substrate-binding protein [Nitrospirota bacterium]|nr:molybdate ABC transporter substrate-binding protein [Nitrospirota bacterium]